MGSSWGSSSIRPLLIASLQRVDVTTYRKALQRPPDSVGALIACQMLGVGQAVGRWMGRMMVDGGG